MPDPSKYAGPVPEMPDYRPPGILGAEDLKKVLAWLEEKFMTKERGFPACEMCQTRNWNLEPHIVTPAIYVKKGFTFDSAYPHVMITCKNCGNVKFFSATQIGIVKKPGEYGAQ